jgi:hypothetical protein
VHRSVKEKGLLLCHLVTTPTKLFQLVHKAILASEKDPTRTMQLISFCSEWISLFPHTDQLIEASDLLAAISGELSRFSEINRLLKQFEVQFQASINHVPTKALHFECRSSVLCEFVKVAIASNTVPSNGECKELAKTLYRAHVAAHGQLGVSELVRYSPVSSATTPLITALSDWESEFISSLECPQEPNKRVLFFQVLLKVASFCMKVRDFATPWAIYQVLQVHFGVDRELSQLVKEYEALKKLFTDSWEESYGRFIGKELIAVSMHVIKERLDQIQIMPSYLVEEEMMINYEKLRSLWQVVSLSRPLTT